MMTDLCSDGNILYVAISVSMSWLVVMHYHLTSGGRSPGSLRGLYYQARESVVLLLQGRRKTFHSSCGLHWQCREHGFITDGQWWISWLSTYSWKASCPTTQRGRETLLPMEVKFQAPHVIHWFQGRKSWLPSYLFWHYLCSVSVLFVTVLKG